MTRHKVRWFSVLAALMLMASALPSAPHSSAQGACRTFVETGKTVCGVFLPYWNTHGGLAQQGYPISEAASEKSDTDGKVYTTQYFERAVFEQHPEFAGTPNEVLLSLLGVFRYQQKYPAGAPGQVPNSAANSQVFQATGKHVGGVFLTYWNTHGGLAQQGYPISEEFNEVSDLNGQAYKVQYFERAVFEQHPEFAGTPNEVLLSQLGTFRWRDKQTPPTPAATATPLVPPTATRPPAPPATNTPVPPPPVGPCDGIPPSPNVIILPSNCESPGTLFGFGAWGFQPGETAGVYVTNPDQSVNGAPFQVDVDEDGYTEGVSFQTRSSSQLGIYAITFEGTESHFRAIGYFKLRP